MNKITSKEFEIAIIEREISRMKLIMANLKADTESYKEKIKGLENATPKDKVGKAGIEARIENYQNQTNEINRRIDTLNEEIKNKESNVASFKKEISEFFKKNILLSVRGVRKDMVQEIINSANKICKKHNVCLEVEK